jgi:hypothetical protein
LLQVVIKSLPRRRLNSSFMESNFVEIRVEGKTLKVPAATIDGKTVIVTGKWIRMAAIMDEELVEGELVKEPKSFAASLKQAGANADILTFAQRLREVTPKYDCHLEWDNAAVVPITTFKEWWEKRLPQETRRNVKRAAKLGVTVKSVSFDDQLLRGIVGIYNETPMRQGRRFWHYGKSHKAVKEETATYLERSEFIGAYHGDELIGFIKIVYAEDCAQILHILSKACHADKRPTNALIAKAVEICVEKRMSYLVYCKYVYGKNDKNPLTEFKRRNGFEQMLYPRYYLPLTIWGGLILKLGLHHGLIAVLPKNLLAALVGMRRKYFEIMERKPLATAQAE